MLKDILKEELKHPDEANIDFLNNINEDFTKNNRKAYIFLVGSNLYKEGQDMDLIVDSVDTKELVSKINKNHKTLPLHISISDIGIGRVSCPIYLNYSKDNRIKGSFDIRYK